MWIILKYGIFFDFIAGFICVETTTTCALRYSVHFLVYNIANILKRVIFTLHRQQLVISLFKLMRCVFENWKDYRIIPNETLEKTRSESKGRKYGRVSTSILPMVQISEGCFQHFFEGGKKDNNLILLKPSLLLEKWRISNLFLALYSVICSK